MSLRRWLPAFLVLALVMLCPCAYGAAPGVDKIIEALRERESKVNTLVALWNTRIDYPSGAMFGKYPCEPTVVRDKWTLIIDCSRLYYDWRGHYYSPDEGQFLASHHRGTFAKGVGHELFVAPARNEPSGVIALQEEGWEMSSGYLWPLLIAFRLTDPVLGRGELDKMQVLGNSQFDGHSCVVVELPDKKFMVTHRLWLDRTNGYRLVKLQCIGPDRNISAKTEFHYAANEGINSLRLASWTYTECDKKAPPVWTNSIDAFTVNEPISADRMRVTFPVGTSVYDKLSGTEYVVQAEHEGPELQEIVPESTVDELVEEQVSRVREETESGAGSPDRSVPRQRPAEDRSASGFLLPAVGGGACIAVVVILLVARGRARQ